MSPRTANKLMYQASLSDQACLPLDMVLLATAVQRARTPTYTKTISLAAGQADDSIIQGEINLWVVCGSAGTLLFKLVRDGGAGGFTTLNVVAGQKVEGHFLQIGAASTAAPIIGFGNLPT
jgi:hypothetical protein